MPATAPCVAAAPESSLLVGSESSSSLSLAPCDAPEAAPAPALWTVDTALPAPSVTVLAAFPTALVPSDPTELTPDTPAPPAEVTPDAPAEPTLLAPETPAEPTDDAPLTAWFNC